MPRIALICVALVVLLLPSVAFAQDQSGSGAPPPPPVVAPSPVASPPPASPAVSPSPPAPGPTPLAIPCLQLPIRGFGQVYGTQPDAYALLGCPNGQELPEDTTLQQFEHGYLLRVGALSASAKPQVYALFLDNQKFAIFPDTYDPATDPLSDNLTPPAGMLEPQGALGKVWRDGTGAQTQARLGWALQPAQEGPGALQSFALGRMVFTPQSNLIFVMADYTYDKPQQVRLDWRVYPNTFTE